MVDDKLAVGETTTPLVVKQQDEDSEAVKYAGDYCVEATTIFNVVDGGDEEERKVEEGT